MYSQSCYSWVDECVLHGNDADEEDMREGDNNGHVHLDP